jgi:hypothetical protein
MEKQKPVSLSLTENIASSGLLGLTGGCVAKILGPFDAGGGRDGPDWIFVQFE